MEKEIVTLNRIIRQTTAIMLTSILHWFRYSAVSSPNPAFLQAKDVLCLMSVLDPQFLTTEDLIFATNPAWLDFCSPLETIAFRLTMTPPGVNLQKANCLFWVKGEILSQAGLLSLPYILISQ